MKMNKNSDSSDDQIGDIKILAAWNDGLTLQQIAKKVGLPIEIVNRSLRQSLKAIIGHGVKRHVQKKVS
jgi:hypothetical protein